MIFFLALFACCSHQRKVHCWKPLRSCFWLISLHIWCWSCAKGGPIHKPSPRDCKKKEKICQTILRVPRCLWGFFACGFQCLRGFPAVLLCPKPPGITLGFAAFPSARGHCWSADPSGPGGAGLSQPHGHSDFQFFSHIPVLLLF